MLLRLTRPRVLPGFGLTLGYTLLYLSLIVILPLSALFFRTASMPWEDFVKTVTDPRVVASYRLTFGAFAGRRDGQRRAGIRGGVDAGSLSLPRTQTGRRCD
jgi:hypothetical protein